MLELRKNQFDHDIRTAINNFAQVCTLSAGIAKDALFDLIDAVLITRSVDSFAELSVSPVFRRQWSSIYEAIQDGNPPRTELMKLYIKQLTPIAIVLPDISLQEDTRKHWLAV